MLYEAKNSAPQNKIPAERNSRLFYVGKGVSFPFRKFLYYRRQRNECDAFIDLKTLLFVRIGNFAYKAPHLFR